MITRGKVSPLWLRLLIVLTVTLVAWAQSSTSGAPLSLEDVVKLCKSGFSEELVITRIKKSGKAFDLSPDELIELRKSVSETIIRYLLDPSQPYTPPPPPVVTQPPPPSASPKQPDPPPTAARQYPPDPNAARIPPEPGIYTIAEGSPAKIEIRVLLGVNEGAGLGKVLLKKGKVVAYLVGPSSKNRVQITMPPVFYFRLPEGKAVEDIALLSMDRKGDRREIEMGPAGPKPELKAESMRPFDSLEVGSRLFRITAGKLTKGEYLFFLLGSAEPPKGTYGKGYDFGVDETPPAANAKKKEVSTARYWRVI
jgi:hypothetical protein